MTGTVGLLWITDGNPTAFDESAKSLSRAWRGPEPIGTVVINDSGDPDHQRWLEDRCRKWVNTVLVHHTGRLGFGAAIESGWGLMRRLSPDWVFHAEHDFVYNQPVEVGAMAHLLRMRPCLAQVSLLRQAVNEAERDAGGLVQSRPGAFEDHSMDLWRRDGRPWTMRWMEQRAYFSTNPSLYSTSLCHIGWPQVPESEGMFSLQLLAEGFGTVPPEDVRFGVWGATTDLPAVTHIGVRQGTGY